MSGREFARFGRDRAGSWPRMKMESVNCDIGCSTAFPLNTNVPEVSARGLQLNAAGVAKWQTHGT